MSANLLSLARNLQHRKARKRRNLAVAEGVRLVEEALRAGVVVRGAIVSPVLSTTARGDALLDKLAQRAVDVHEVDDRTMGSVSDTESTQGVLAIIEPPRSELAAIRPTNNSPVIVLDAVQDPGNVGALLRTAFGLGAAGAILLRGTADPANPKVLRASMGASFHWPVVPADDAAFQAWIRQAATEVWVCDLEGQPIQRVTAPSRVALVVGNEGAGLSPSVAELSHRRVTIPLSQGAESLNVVVAAGIILYEVQRAN